MLSFLHPCSLLLQPENGCPGRSGGTEKRGRGAEKEYQEEKKQLTLLCWWTELKKKKRKKKKHWHDRSVCLPTQKGSDCVHLGLRCFLSASLPVIGQEPSGSTHDIGSRGNIKKAKTKYAQIIQALGRDDVMKCCHIFPGRLFISPPKSARFTLSAVPISQRNWVAKRTINMKECVFFFFFFFKDQQ